jgi:hypothetical protein
MTEVNCWRRRFKMISSPASAWGGESGQREPEEREQDFGAILDPLPAMVGYWDTKQTQPRRQPRLREFLG